MPYSYALAQHGTTLATRPFGSQLRAEVIQKAAGHQLVELDFSGVLSASHSFADEFVARLAEESKLGRVGFDLSISGAAPEVDSVVRRALDRRDVQLSQPV